MTPEERDKIDQLVKSVTQLEATQLEINSHIHEELKTMQYALGTISRGIYGDEQNKFKGVIERQIDAERKHSDQETKIQKIEKNQYRMGVWGSGLVIGLQAAWVFLKDRIF